MTSRPASGAEHQFSHLWDMQHHTHDGAAPSHGFKVGVATVAVARFYEALFRQTIDVDRALAAWKPWDAVEADIRTLFDVPELRDKAIEETRAKFRSKDDVRALMQNLASVFDELKSRIRTHLPPAEKVVRMLKDVGAPTEPEEIGISRPRMRDSFRLAYHIRRRFTVLDVAVLSGRLDDVTATLFR